MQTLSTFDYILEIHEDGGRTIDDVMEKVMSSEVRLSEQSSEEEEDCTAHQRTMQCIDELEIYAFVHNKSEMKKYYLY